MNEITARRVVSTDPFPSSCVIFCVPDDRLSILGMFLACMQAVNGATLLGCLAANRIDKGRCVSLQVSKYFLQGQEHGDHWAKDGVGLQISRDQSIRLHVMFW